MIAPCATGASKVLRLTNLHILGGMAFINWKIVTAQWVGSNDISEKNGYKGPSGMGKPLVARYYAVLCALEVP